MKRQSRYLALDALRGLIIVLMALDHANYFVAQQHSSGEHWGGAFPAYSDGLTFLTRWVTHPVAPAFMFLMGAGMTLFAHSRRNKGWSEWEIIRHFLIRGGLLITLQLLVVNRAWQLGPTPFPSVYIGVLFALGGGMILGSLFLRLGAWQLVSVAIALFIGTELLNPNPSEWGQIFDNPAGLLFGYSGGSMEFWSNYPILPWFELVIFGMAFGRWMIRDPERALNTGLALGLLFLIGFVILRTLDGFGNIRPRAADTWIDYLNVVKYPPAMTFTLVTMGLNLIVLWLFSKAGDLGRRLLRPFVVFGKAPLFFYLSHLFLYAVIGILFARSGTSIPEMYPYWLLGLLILFPPTLWYGVFKHRQPPNSLLRFL
ncbi:MAG: DUF1624 domain-containing protein [Anaerolineales bacterium]